MKTGREFFLSKTYIKNRAGLGFLFFSGKNYLGNFFFNMFLGFSRIRLHHKSHVLNHFAYIFEDFYSNFNVLLIDIYSKFSFDFSFFASNIHLNKIFSFSY